MYHNHINPNFENDKNTHSKLNFQLNVGNRKIYRLGIGHGWELVLLTYLKHLPCTLRTAKKLTNASETEVSFNSAILHYLCSRDPSKTLNKIPVLLSIAVLLLLSFSADLGMCMTTAWICKFPWYHKYEIFTSYQKSEHASLMKSMVMNHPTTNSVESISFVSP